jgi:hypothetical protein
MIPDIQVTFRWSLVNSIKHHDEMAVLGNVMTQRMIN